MGSGPAGEERQRPTTRTTKVVEIELRSPMKTEKQKPARKVVTETSIQEEVISPEGQDYFSEDLMTETVETEAAPSVSFEKYTVQKNDTLQKISQKYYGTSKKYLKIYEANKDTLKGPDKIRPGQVLKIPVTSRNTLMEEPQENLK
ncbi:MAG: LysM peptidoglycan-binding domain-containing protein [Candidatus Omnitrophica bacterium]|nr:LysM peptidoglycan-binding domain-containing protein [Candidatus Omnitrophota bacterium]MBU1870466.1 LysM peptidoglycan-binding domain-containing protein [Candidatus Omnitrophota bacterium]